MFFPIMWAIIAGAAIIAELMTGTLYLLVVGLAAGIAGSMAFGDSGLAVQLLGFIVSCALGFFLLRRRKQVLPAVMAGDIGSRVEVITATGHTTFRVRHSGTEWDAFIDAPVPSEVPTHLLVVGVEGTRLKCKLDDTSAT